MHECLGSACHLPVHALALSFISRGNFTEPPPHGVHIRHERKPSSPVFPASHTISAPGFQLPGCSPITPLWTSLCSTLKSRRPRPLPQNTENPSSSCRLHLLSSFLFCLLFFFNLFIFGYAGSSWQHTGFLQLRRGGATLQLRCAGLLRWLLLLWSPGSGCRGLIKLLQPVGSVVGLVGSRAQAQ